MTGAGTETPPIPVLLASARDWFASSLRAVLEPEGFAFVHVRSGREALDVAAERPVDLVIVDEGLPDVGAAELCRELVSGPLRRVVPILVYSPNFWHEREQTEAMQAGAWDIIREPIRSRLLVAKLQRLLQIRRLIQATEESSFEDPATGVFPLGGLLRTLPILGSLAERAQVPLTCAVLGPTRPAAGEELERQRRETAALCAGHTRVSDLRGWLGDCDVVLIMYDAGVPAATGVVKRLNEQALALRQGPGAEESVPLSAGIVPLDPGKAAHTAERTGAESTPTQLDSLARFAAAQNALREVRSAGGGIRIAETA